MKALVAACGLGGARGSGRDRRGAMSAALILIIIVAVLCVALLVLFGALWVALHFGVGHEDDD